MQFCSSHPPTPNLQSRLEKLHPIEISSLETVYFRVSRDPASYVPVRSHIENGMSPRFVGWDNQFDQQFDAYSCFFLLFDQWMELLAGSRLVLSEDAINPLPIQLSETNWTLPSHDAGEYSGFWYRQQKYGLLLAGLGADWIHRNLKPIDIYAIYETRSRAMRSIYLDMMEMSPLGPGAEVSYPEFRYRRTTKSVSWTAVMEQGISRRDRARNILSKVHSGLQLPVSEDGHDAM